MKIRLALVGAALALSACEATPPAVRNLDRPPPPGEVDGSRPPSPATIAMRWQWLNPEVNSFTFRNTKDVFAWRDVQAPEVPSVLHRSGTSAMPRAMVAGKQVDYDAWAERTFTNAFLVLRDGSIIFEDYRNRMTQETPHIGFSMTKTITAMLIGQALDRGEIASLDDRVSQYLPQLESGAYGQACLRDLMEMRSGADIVERYDFGENPSLAAQIHESAIVLNQRRFADFAVAIGARAEPGAQFNYASLDTAVLGWVLEEATGERLEDLTQSGVWQPIGAEYDAYFLADGQVGEGRALNSMGFNASLRDFGRLGQLLLDGGMAGDTRVLPEGWVEQMTTMKPTGLDGFPGYGLQTWQVDDEPGAFAAVGLAGQFLYVHPQSRMVIVKLSYNPPVEPAWLTGEVLAYFAAIAAAE